MESKPTTNTWAHNPDVEYIGPFGNPIFLPIVEGMPYYWDEHDGEFTIQQAIDAAFDAGRLDVVKQLASRL